MTHPRQIYRRSYAADYDAVYLLPWKGKHEANERLLAGLLDDVASGPGRWLDLGCGQGWHFGRFPGRLPQVGVDSSPAQLAQARRRSPGARYVCADLATLALPAASCSLVTCFWAAYCYLDDAGAIAGLVRRACGWVRLGGALYFEVLPAENLPSFNDSTFARATGFRAEPRGGDFSRWSYEDAGGLHRMTSPPTASFVAWIEGAFAQVRAIPAGFMVHLVARRRR